MTWTGKERPAAVRPAGVDASGRRPGRSGARKAGALLLLGLAALVACGDEGGEPAADPATRAGVEQPAGARTDPAADSSPEQQAPGTDPARPPEPVPGAGADRPARPERVESALTRGDTLPGRPSWTREDLEVLQATLAWAREEHIDTLPPGERVGRIGERFVGAPYVPQTLDPPGPERLVVNLRAFDCVTFVESMLTLAHVVALPPAGSVDGPDALMHAYQAILTAIRYRGGLLAGYPSRLHYFSEWIADNEAKGFVEDVTESLGGRADPEPPTFMTEHREAYHQLSDPATFEAIAAMETGLADLVRHVVPEERVQALEAEIRTGDIIAATSTLPGLDVAHTGIALRRDGVLRLMHAPLVGEAVQISDLPLGERLLGISAQDGIMVARPQPHPPVVERLGAGPGSSD